VKKKVAGCGGKVIRDGGNLSTEKRQKGRDDGKGKRGKSTRNHKAGFKNPRPL